MTSKEVNGVFCLTILLLFFYVHTNTAANEQVIYISNLNDSCLKCLCEAATGCNLTIGCDMGYCGPLKVSRIYWADASKVILPEDDPDRSGAFEDCALSYSCALKMVKNYLIKFGRDCNKDGVTDCDDFSMINFNGGYQCQPPLERSDAGKKWLKRYHSCSKR